MKTIYLCGPMAGCNDKEATGWRNKVIIELLSFYKILNPMVRDFRTGYNRTENESFIVEHDKRDVDAADILLAVPWKPSVGTSMEILYAWEKKKQVLLVLPDAAGSSPWLTYHSHEIFTTIEHAIAYLRRGWPNDYIVTSTPEV